MSTVRVFKKDPGTVAPLIGCLAIGSSVFGLLISGFVIEFNPMAALIIIVTAVVLTLGGAYTYMMLATEPAQE